MYKRTLLPQSTIRLSSIIFNKILKTNRIPKRKHRKQSKTINQNEDDLDHHCHYRHARLWHPECPSQVLRRRCNLAQQRGGKTDRDARNCVWNAVLTLRFDSQEARSFVYDACHSNGGMFTSNYAPLQLKAMCPRSGNMGVEFVVQNQNRDTGFDLGDDDCSERLNDEIFGCAHGGESVIAGWYFR